jgi:hypothetical protein
MCSIWLLFQKATNKQASTLATGTYPASKLKTVTRSCTRTAQRCWKMWYVTDKGKIMLHGLELAAAVKEPPVSPRLLRSNVWGAGAGRITYDILLLREFVIATKNTSGVAYRIADLLTLTQQSGEYAQVAIDTFSCEKRKLSQPACEN